MSVTRVRLIAEAGLTIALAAVLHLFSIWQMPQGGNVSLSMLPLFVFAIMRGPVAGMAAGALYGVVDLIMEPFLVHPAQVVLDYPLAFALVGLAGLASTRWHMLAAKGRIGAAISTAVIPGVIIGALGRYASHFVSGLVFFKSYAIELGKAPVAYSLAYNSFVLVSAAACAVVAAIVLPALERLEPSGGPR